MHCFEPNPIAAQQLAPPCARELASKRALHPIHNVKQPENSDQRTDVRHPLANRALKFVFLERSFKPEHPDICPLETGGAERDRTDDLLLAKQALSQLSYGPIKVGRAPASGSSFALAELVGQGRFELPTSRLSSARSNQLSY